MPAERRPTLLPLPALPNLIRVRLR